MGSDRKHGHEHEPNGERDADSNASVAGREAPVLTDAGGADRAGWDYEALRREGAQRLAAVEAVQPLAERAAAGRAALQAICDRLLAEVPHYHWVGFYLVWPEDPRMLQLGPFAGAPTEHTRIPFGRGICGQVAERQEALWIPDVTAEDNYLACSLETRSEVVVPVMWQERFVGQLDIDSHVEDPFGLADHELLEGLCADAAPVVGMLLDAHRTLP
jgi:GAF domain-containing protein